MVRLVTCCHVALAVSIGLATPAFAQFTPRSSTPSVIRQLAAAGQTELRGTVVDNERQPLAGAVVSAVGSTSAFAITERDGSFVLRNLPAGPYLVRVHLQGYVAPRARVVQASGGAQAVPVITMSGKEDAGRQVLEAGMGSGGERPAAEAAGTSPLDASEVAWRLRHVRRSVLKDVEMGAFVDDAAPEVVAGWLPAYGSRQAGAGSWFADLPFYGRVDLLTSTSFDRPVDLLSFDAGAPTGVTSLALAAPIGAGDWSVQAGLTQGDIASWLVSSSFARRGQTAHHYEAGISYGAQQYQGGNAYMLAALSDGTRNVGEIYASDQWSLGRHVEVNYGAKYARYDYLDNRNLLSPNVSVTIVPDPESSLRLRASASRREVAPGASEFLAPSTGPWLPAQRTFSPLSGNGFERQRVDTFEVSAERQWAGDFTVGVRGFRQAVDGQVVTLFGMAQPGSPVASIGHYYVASGGDFEAQGWGLSFTRRMLDGVRASIDYTVTDANWVRPGADAVRLSRVASSAVRTDPERTYDLRAAVESEVPQTATRFFVLYKINSGFATTGQDALPRSIGARFDVQVNQGLPFLKFSTSQWEMLVAVRNMFYEGAGDGSVYDELLVVRAPKRIVGGLSVRF